MTRDETIKVVGYLNAAYPTNKLDDAAAQVFSNFLSDLDFESCRWAVKKWIQNEKWFPSIAELIDVTRKEMTRRRSEVPALPSGGRYLTREENQARLVEIKALIANSTGPVFNPRTRREALAPDSVRPAPPAPRSRHDRNPSSPEEPT